MYYIHPMSFNNIIAMSDFIKYRCNNLGLEIFKDLF